MDFSVVIPLFNKAPHIRETIRSVLDQSLPPREIIVVDDGSTDGGLDIVGTIPDARIKVLTRSPPGPGGYAARNLGIRSATGAWIAFLDADDLWYANHLETLSGVIEACSGQVGCAFSRFEAVDGKRRWIYPVSERLLAEGRPLSLGTMIDAWLETDRCPMWTGVAAFRREVLMEAGLFPEGRARRGGDKDTWLRAMAQADTAFSSLVTAEFRQDSVNRVTKGTPHTELPIITDTISSLIPTVEKSVAKRLRALSNRETTLYAKYAAGAQSRIGPDFFRRIYLPEGFGALARIFALMGVGFSLRLIRPKRRVF